MGTDSKHLWWQTGAIYQFTLFSGQERQVALATLGRGCIILSTHLDR
jgi:hypothetical protein